MASRSTRGARGAGQNESFTVTSNLREVLADLKEFDPALARSTRRALRRSGDDAINDMRAILDQPPPGVVTGVTKKRRKVVAVHTRAATRRSTGRSRAFVKKNLKTRVVAGKRRQGIHIRGDGSPFSRSYNLKRWRHPIRFNPDVTTADQVPWVEQAGRPYFGKPIANRAGDMRKNIEQALTEALQKVEA